MFTYHIVRDVADKNNDKTYNVERWLRSSSDFNEILKERNAFPSEANLENGKCTSKLSTLGAHRVRIISECDYDVKVES